MKTIWARSKPHILAWHMLPCLVMVAFALGVVAATGRASSLVGAVGCMLMMAAMGGHDHGGHADHDRDE